MEATSKMIYSLFHGPRRLLLFVLMVGVLLLLATGVWASPDQSVVRGTVPTRTPTKSPPTLTPAPPTPEPPTAVPDTPEPTKAPDKKGESATAPTMTPVDPTVAATATTNPVTTVRQYPVSGGDKRAQVYGTVGALVVFGLGTSLMMWLRATSRP